MLLKGELVSIDEKYAQEAIASADMNLDGMVDAVTVGQWGQVNIWLGNDKAEFTEVKQTSLQTHIGERYYLSSGDIDQDGDEDIIATGTHGITAYISESPFRYSTKALTEDKVYYGVKVADINLDGYPDIVAIDDEEGAKIFLNNQDLTFTLNQQSFSPDFTASYLDAADYDLDGDVDLLLYRRYNDVEIWRNESTKGKVSFNHLQSFSDRMHYATFKDMDGDGILEIFGRNAPLGSYTKL